MRCFIALKLPDFVSKTVYDFTEQLCCQLNIKHRMIPKVNYHITLKFLGLIEIDKIKEIETRLDTISKTVDPIGLSLGKLLFFPSRAGGSIVVKINGGLSTVYTMNGKMAELGYAENKRFAPHLTICKLKGKIVPLLQNKEFKNVRFSADSFSLFESKLTPDGSIYTELKNFKWRKM